MKPHGDFEMIEENLSHSSQKNVYKCGRCGKIEKMYIRTVKEMNKYFNQYYKDCK